MSKKLERGAIWEFYNGSTGETRTYELENTYERGLHCTLRNVENGKPAYVFTSTLHRGPEKPSVTGSFWKFVGEPPVPEFEEKAEVPA